MNKKILISVVIPAFNEEKILSATLKSLEEQDFKGDYEVIVVDNNSTDNTAKIAKNFRAKIVSEPKPGIAYARQKGFNSALGEIIASTDADTIVSKDWLSKIYRIFSQNKEVIGFTGGIKFYGSKTFRAALANLFSPITKMISYLTSNKGYFTGANFAIKREVFEKTNGFNTSLVVGEDVDLAQRAKKYGKIVYFDNVSVTTSARRFAGSSPYELYRYHMLSFFSLIFFNKAKVNKIKNIRDTHNPEITSQRAKIFSFAASAVILALIFLFLLIYAGLNPRSQFAGKVYWHQKTYEKVIALTFDDGPNEPYTSQIDQILKDNNIKATFFEIGKNVQYYPETTKKLFAEGHIIANHSYSHQISLAIEKQKTQKQELLNTQEIIYGVIGEKPHLFRPPHGFHSPFLLESIKQEDLVPITWSDMTNDYSRPGVDKITKNILKKVRPGGIIVLHDGDSTNHGSDRSQTVEALKRIISELKKQGYTFVTISELLNVPAYNE